MEDDKKSYVLVTSGTDHGPHVLVNPADESDVLALCACGCSQNPEHRCDGSHKAKVAKADGHTCCGGGHCAA
jgi:CDGSH-type Zn-finger protein